VSEMSERSAKITESMLRKVELLERMYSVADELVKFKPDQCFGIDCHKCDLHPECGIIHKFLSHLNEIATLHLLLLGSLLRKRLGGL